MGGLQKKVASSLDESDADIGTLSRYIVSGYRFVKEDVGWYGASVPYLVSLDYIITTAREAPFEFFSYQYIHEFWPQLSLHPTEERYSYVIFSGISFGIQQQQILGILLTSCLDCLTSKNNFTGKNKIR